MIKILLQLYLIFSLSVIVHELFHLAVLAILKRKINYLLIGCRKISFRLGKVRISPVIRSAHIDIDQQQITSMNRCELVLFFLSGSLGNACLLLLSLTGDSSIMNNGLFFINLLSIISSLVPLILPGNDMALLLMQLKSGKSGAS